MKKGRKKVRAFFLKRYALTSQHLQQLRPQYLALLERTLRVASASIQLRGSLSGYTACTVHSCRQTHRPSNVTQLALSSSNAPFSYIYTLNLEGSTISFYF